MGLQIHTKYHFCNTDLPILGHIGGRIVRITAPANRTPPLKPWKTSKAHAHTQKLLYQKDASGEDGNKKTYSCVRFVSDCPGGRPHCHSFAHMFFLILLSVFSLSAGVDCSSCFSFLFSVVHFLFFFCFPIVCILFFFFLSDFHM